MSEKCVQNVILLDMKSHIQSHTSIMKSITHWYLHYNTTFVQISSINRNKHPYSLSNNCHTIIYARICRNCQK